jgi:hypothetical protein
MVCREESCIFKSEIQGERVTAQKDFENPRNTKSTSLESKAKGFINHIILIFGFGKLLIAAHCFLAPTHFHSV